MSKDKNRVKVNTSKVKMMYKKNNAMEKFKQMSLVQNYFF